MKYCGTVVAESLQPLPESVTFCATVDEGGEEQVITDMMIRRACEQLEDSQMWPCAAMSEFASALVQGASSHREAVILQFPSNAG